VLLALLEETGGKEKERCKKREGEEIYEIDIEKSSPRSAKTKRRNSKGHCNIVFDGTEGDGSVRRTRVKTRREKEGPARRTRWPVPSRNGTAA